MGVSQDGLFGCRASSSWAARFFPAAIGSSLPCGKMRSARQVRNRASVGSSPAPAIHIGLLHDILQLRRASYGRRPLCEKTVQEPRLETLDEREIYSSTGTTWRVREARAIDVPGATAPTCLIFDSGNRCTRLWRYPAEWFQMSAEQLLAVMNYPRWRCDE